jgi:hypothetical protein
MNSKLILEAARGTLDGTLSFPGSAGVTPATFGVLAGRIFAHRFIRRDVG